MAVYASTHNCPQCTHVLQWELDVDSLTGVETIDLLCRMCARRWLRWEWICYGLGRVLRPLPSPDMAFSREGRRMARPPGSGGRQAQLSNPVRM